MTSDIKETFKKACASIGGAVSEEDGQLVCRIDTADIVLFPEKKVVQVIPTFAYEQPIKSSSDVVNLMKEILESSKKLKK